MCRATCHGHGTDGPDSLAAAPVAPGLAVAPSPADTAPAPIGDFGPAAVTPGPENSVLDT